MFWTDWGETPKIEKCGMNGDPNTRQTLISNNILWPNALSIDYTIDRIWWADAKLHTIESADLEGRGRRIILSENINHPFALTLFQNYMYWTDWEHHRGSINKANKFTGEERSVLQESLYSPMDIHVYHQQRQPAGRSCFETVAWERENSGENRFFYKGQGRVRVLKVSEKSGNFVFG